MEGKHLFIPAIAQMTLGPMALPVPLSATIIGVVSSVAPLVHFSISIRYSVTMTNGFH